jgi:hypothetical protein
VVVDDAHPDHGGSLEECKKLNSRPPTAASDTSYKLAAVVAATTLAACKRPDDGNTVGQKVDSALAKVEQKTDEVKSDLRAAGQDARQATANTMDAVSGKAKDAAITTSINAELAKDAQLSALRIDVDTVAGKVALHGTAPDAASRERATTLAARVDRVKSVDNPLTVGPTS